MSVALRRHIRSIAPAAAMAVLALAAARPAAANFITPRRWDRRTPTPCWA